MPTEIGRDDDEFEDWTVDPSDPEPRFVDLDNPSEEESANLQRLDEAQSRGLRAPGAECHIDGADDYEPGDVVFDEKQG